MNRMIRNRLLRLVSLILIIVFIVSLVSCSSEPDEQAKKTINSTQDDTDINYSSVKSYFTEAESLLNQLPDIDFGGAELRIAAPDYSTVLPDSLNDSYSLAISYRNFLVEKKLNCKIVAVQPAESGSFIDTVNQQNSSEDCCELAFVPSGLLPTLITQNAVADIGMLPFVDLTKSYYDSDADYSLKLGSYTYGVCGAATYSPENEYCVFFNERIIENLGLDSPVNLYRSNNWTWDKLLQMATSAYKDIDGNGYFDENDRYGLTATVSDSDLIDVICASANQRYIENTPSSLTLVYNNEKTSSIISTAQYILNQEMFFGDKKKVNSQANGLFINGGSMFMIAPLSEAVNISAMKNDFGLVPLPKISSEQPNYYTMLGDSAPVICVLSGAKNTDLAGAALEALSAASYHSLEQAFAELYMQYYLRNETSVRMLTDINNKIYYETVYMLGSAYAELTQYTVDIVKNAVIKGGAFQSGYRAAETAFNKFIQSGSINLS